MNRFHMRGYLTYDMRTRAMASAPTMSLMAGSIMSLHRSSKDSRHTFNI